MSAPASSVSVRCPCAHSRSSSSGTSRFRNGKAQRVYRVSGTWERDGRPTGDLFVVQGNHTSRFDLRKRNSYRPRPRPSATVCWTEPELAHRPTIFSSRPMPAGGAVGRRRDRRLSPLEARASDDSRFQRQRTSIPTLPTSPSPTRQHFATCSLTRGSNMWVYRAMSANQAGCLRWIGPWWSRSSASRGREG